MKRNLKAFNHPEVALCHCNCAAAQLATPPQAFVKQLPMCIFCVLTLCIFYVQISIIDLLNIFADHKYTMKILRMRRQLVPGPVVRLTVIKAKTRPGIEASSHRCKPFICNRNLKEPLAFKTLYMVISHN